jgi:APA family basic amino acid/polyamine antiporter
VISFRWVSAAAHAGPGSVALWFLGAVFLVVPLAVSVGALTVKYPSAGGIYVWTRNDFGPWHGFLCFFCYWVQMALILPTTAIFFASIGGYSAGLADNRVYVLIASLAVIWLALGTNIVGINVGKWTQNIGGATPWLLAGLLCTAACLIWRKQGSATPLQFMPAWNWDTVNQWGSIAFAMSGLEMVGFLAGEMRNPQRDVPIAGWIASAFVVAFYSSATIALLVILRPENISEVSGLAQTALAAGGILGAPWLLPAVILLVAVGIAGQLGGQGASVSRMPYAAGVDHLLPAAFARLHPRWATPYISILALGAVASALLLLLQLGDTMRAAYQSLVSLMVITGFLPYFYLFGSAWIARKRISAISGFAVTLLVLGCSAVPTPEIHNVWLFEGKLAAGTLGTIAIAWLMYQKKRVAEFHQPR